MIKKLLKYVGVAVACLVVVVLSSALLYRKYLQHKVAEERAITSPNGINSLEAGYKNLGYLLLKAQRMAVTKTEFIVIQKAA